LSRCRGFTLLELLASAGILIALYAILLPVLASAKESAHKVSCTSNLKQIYEQISLYRVDWDGEGKYGTSYQMALPADWNIPLLHSLKCSDADNEMFTPKSVSYYIFWLEPEVDGRHPSWDEYSLSSQGNSILVGDLNHNDKSKPLLYGSFITRYALGVVETGSLVKIHKQGDWLNLNWWRK
jgi:type II secretory pathway pseudopilin PulG